MQNEPPNPPSSPPPDHGLQHWYSWATTLRYDPTTEVLHASIARTYRDNGRTHSAMIQCTMHRTAPHAVVTTVRNDASGQKIELPEGMVTSTDETWKEVPTHTLLMYLCRTLVNTLEGDLGHNIRNYIKDTLGGHRDRHTAQHTIGQLPMLM